MQLLLISGASFKSVGSAQCKTAGLYTPADDTIQLQLNGKLIYDATPSSKLVCAPAFSLMQVSIELGVLNADGGPNDTLVSTRRITARDLAFFFWHSSIASHTLIHLQFPLEIRDSASGAFDVGTFLLPYSPDFPDPEARRIEALFNTADIKNNPSHAKPTIVGQV